MKSEALQHPPSHVAVIMDGNGRWAKKKLMNRIKGHEKGADTVRTIVTASREIGVGVLTLYAFSTENWARPETEVTALMSLLKKFIRTETPRLKEQNIRLNAIGNTEGLPADVREYVFAAMEETAGNDGMILNLALNYGSREELTSAVKTIASKLQKEEIAEEDITEAVITDQLYTAGQPEPDLLIRTSGEMRLSNFLLWQSAYTEFFFTDTLWPDFTRREFEEILSHFKTRNRRFGKTTCSLSDGSPQ
ncbi:MAG: isoprenyl transferase [Desulfarculaceae bacterium]|nr:isoprenyl transferase [Desulfarculaceae bacterium]